MLTTITLKKLVVMLQFTAIFSYFFKHIALSFNTKLIFCIYKKFHCTQNQNTAIFLYQLFHLLKKYKYKKGSRS